MVNLLERLHAVWRELDGADPRTHAHKLATSSTHHAWMTSPIKPSTARVPPHLLPRYPQLELSRHMLCNCKTAMFNIAHFCLRAHTLGAETGCWRIHKRQCDKCDLHDVQGEKHVLFYALALTCANLSWKFAEQFANFRD